VNRDGFVTRPGKLITYVRVANPIVGTDILGERGQPCHLLPTSLVTRPLDAPVPATDVERDRLAIAGGVEVEVRAAEIRDGEHRAIFGRCVV